jgi:hypothetical protein
MMSRWIDNSYILLLLLLLLLLPSAAPVGPPRKKAPCHGRRCRFRCPVTDVERWVRCPRSSCFMTAGGANATTTRSRRMLRVCWSARVQARRSLRQAKGRCACLPADTQTHAQRPQANKTASPYHSIASYPSNRLGFLRRSIDRSQRRTPPAAAAAASSTRNKSSLDQHEEEEEASPHRRRRRHRPQAAAPMGTFAGRGQGNRSQNKVLAGACVSDQSGGVCLIDCVVSIETEGAVI